jgi:hypothetical protein
MFFVIFDIDRLLTIIAGQMDPMGENLHQLPSTAQRVGAQRWSWPYRVDEIAGLRFGSSRC